MHLNHYDSYLPFCLHLTPRLFTWLHRHGRKMWLWLAKCWVWSLWKCDLLFPGNARWFICVLIYMKFCMYLFMYVFLCMYLLYLRFKGKASEEDQCYEMAQSEPRPKSYGTCWKTKKVVSHFNRCAALLQERVE